MKNKQETGVRLIKNQENKMVIARNIIVLSVFVFFLLTGTVPAFATGPKKASKTDKCPVCGMFVYKYPDWTAQIIFKDGTVVFFDGCKDLFKYYLNLKKYSPEKNPEDIDAVYVSDYYLMKSISAFDAFFVVGSDIYGPMGHELIPLNSSEDAEDFKKDHKGSDILKFDEVTREIIDKLD
jgi:copper chaperone NosL